MGIEFYLQVNFRGKLYRYRVYEGTRTLAYQYFHLEANNKTISFRTNLPVLRRQGITTRPVIEVSEGKINNEAFQTELIEALWKELEKRKL